MNALLIICALLGGFAGNASAAVVQDANAGRAGQTMDLKSLPENGRPRWWTFSVPSARPA